MQKHSPALLRVLILVLGCLLIVGIGGYFWTTSQREETPKSYTKHTNQTLGIHYAIPSDMTLENEDTAGEIAVIMFAKEDGRRIAIYRQQEQPGKPIDTGNPPSWITLSQKDVNGQTWRMAVSDKSKSTCDENQKCGLIARTASTSRNGYNYRISYLSPDNTNETFEHLIESFAFSQ